MEQERRTNVKAHTKGRVTIPTDIDVVPETLELLERWGQTQSGIAMGLIIPKN